MLSKPRMNHHHRSFVGGFRPLSPTILARNPPPSLDYLSHTVPYDESIMEVMSLDDMPRKDHHHRSSFLPHYHMVEEQFASAVCFDIFIDLDSLILTHDVESKGNLCNTTKTIPVYISVKPSIPKNIQIGQNSSPS